MRLRDGAAVYFLLSVIRLELNFVFIVTTLTVIAIVGDSTERKGPSEISGWVGDIFVRSKTPLPAATSDEGGILGVGLRSRIPLREGYTPSHEEVSHPHIPSSPSRARRLGKERPLR